MFVPSAPIEAGGGSKLCRFVVGTSTSGWTANDCDYLCDGTADDVEINAAIQALPSIGGEVVILDGTYNITGIIAMNKDNVKLSGNGTATILKRMWDSSVSEGVITVTAANGGCCIESFWIDGNMSGYIPTNYGIYLSSSNNNTVTGNTCNNNNYGIEMSSSNNNTVTGNTCIRGTGQASDYTSSQYTIRLSGTSSNYNLIACNNIMGKNYTSNGGTGNTFVNNKFE